MVMAKSATTYLCDSCGYRSPQYLGKCPNCDGWNTLVETLAAPDKKTATGVQAFVKPERLMETVRKPLKRLASGVSELDRVLGGGIVPGSVVLLAGDPGIGKSTLLLEIAANFKSLYISGEESPEQIKLRADRMGLKYKDLFVLGETNVDQVIAASRSTDFQLLIVDSIQTIVTDELSSSAGSVAQVRESAFRLHRLAKDTGLPTFIIGQITKEGNIAGPKVLEHLVDTVLFLEGEQHHTFRILSASKNRFGPVEEIGVFEMNEKGMVEVKNPSKQFLTGRISAPGTIVVPVLEGSRSVLTEIQALTNQTNFGLPIRRSFGFDQNRLQLLVATLIKRASVQLQNQDIFINVAGGLKLTEPAADLAVCLAIASSATNQVISSKTIGVGEVGLLGEIREVPFLDKRLEEARRLGFTKFITPRTAKTLREALDLAKQK